MQDIVTQLSTVCGSSMVALGKSKINTTHRASIEQPQQLGCGRVLLFKTGKQALFLTALAVIKHDSLTSWRTNLFSSFSTGVKFRLTAQMSRVVTAQPVQYRKPRQALFLYALAIVKHDSLMSWRTNLFSSFSTNDKFRLTAQISSVVTA